MSDDGFVFDDGPHISFTKDPRLQDLFAKNIDGKYETLNAYVNNYYRGSWVKHPASGSIAVTSWPSFRSVFSKNGFR